VPPNFGSELKPAVSDRPHEIDSPPRTIRFIPLFDVGRTSRGTKTAVYAIEEQFIINAGVVIARCNCDGK
jgi:hypothetical protein